MKKSNLVFLSLIITINAAAQTESNKNEQMDRTALTHETYEKLFGGKALTGQGNDPELMEILQKFIFGEVFHTGVLTDRERELITIVVLTTQQTLPQLKAHTKAALNIDVKPIEIREAIYQCAPFIGFPKTLNALGIINEVFQENGIPLPLEVQATVTEEDRFEKGSEIQYPLYGDEIKEFMKMLPGNFKDDVPRFLTELLFADFYTRGGLDIKTRELLIFSGLVTIGAEFQITAHASGNLKAGNNKEKLIAVIVQCLPYIGFPNSINAINLIKNIDER
ncbi:MAG: 4-carboxymuconolactone decarboxylase [Cytophagaceae bacterium]|nr:4-carboxymuconolactone decarboxylase [Cytophagaceae bacterium]|tara:strand:+ start:4273 stop:5109 length:837 start_codon:yes stop_codon:yes gene_type:complete